MSFKFKCGDKVIADIHVGKIVSIRKENGIYIYRVKFDNDKLIPPEMDYKDGCISFKHEHKTICPICKTRWKIIKFNMQVWKDCEKCGKTQEDLIKEATEKEKLPKVPTSDLTDKLLSDFEKMLDSDGSYDTYDDDEFFFGI